MKRQIDYYVGFTVSIILSVKYLNSYGINLKGVLVVAIIQLVFQIFYYFYSKLKRKRKKDKI